MLQRLRIKRRNREIVERVYGELVTFSRSPHLYMDKGIPDTVMGRFEALSIHVVLFLRRCRGEPALQSIAQDVVDRFITDVEQAIRELGVGDPSVPKRMRKLAGIFYERLATYDAALDGGGSSLADLAAALATRAVSPEAGEGASLRLATYISEMKKRFETMSADTILAGRIERGEEA